VRHAHDPTGKEKKKVAKTTKADETPTAAPTGRSQEDFKAMLALLNEEPLPPVEEREKYFMEQVGIGEQLLARGRYP
jgi:import receptor subunit TOM20